MPADSGHLREPPVPASEALMRLREGNRRFVADSRDPDALLCRLRRDELVAGQAPFAVVLGCSDSRVPVEIVFDQSLGDLFVIRVAGNIAASSQIGSVEYAVEAFGVGLVVVLGHSGCGAVKATLDQLQGVGGPLSPGMLAIVDRIGPAVEGLLVSRPRGDRQTVQRQAVRANVRMAADRLRRASGLLEERCRDGALLVVGAEYSLETGVVDFFDGVPV